MGRAQQAARDGVESERGRGLGPPRTHVLAEYRRRKLDLAELIRGAMHLAEQRDDGDRAEQARDLLGRLAEDRFQLAVVGRPSAGKSTLVNAILGYPYLPAGALPMTSVITSVGYGSRPRAVVRRADRALPIETSIDDVARFITQASAEREELGVTSVEIELPAEVLRSGVWFVDTPGVGSPTAANTAMTERFLPEADAMIFVTSFEAPLDEADLRLLEEIRRYDDRLFFVVNKRDLVSKGVAEDVVQLARARVGGRSAEARTFAVSARRALEGRSERDPELLETSGLLVLERALIGFLAKEKPRSFLLKMCERAGQLVACLKMDLELGRVARGSASHGSDASVQTFDDRITEIVGAERAVAATLQAHLRSELPGVVLRLSMGWSRDISSLLEREVKEGWPAATGPTASEQIKADRVWLERSGKGSIEAWLRRRLPEIRSMVLELAGDQIDELTELAGSVETTAAETFGLWVSEPRPAPLGWSSAELPQLALGPVSLRVPSRSRWRFVLMRFSRRVDHQRRLIAGGLPEASAVAVDRMREALVVSALGWAAELGARAERMTLEAAARVRRRLMDPGTDPEMDALEDLVRSIERFRHEVAAWDPDATDPARDLSVAMPPPSEDESDRLPRCVLCEGLRAAAFRYMVQAQRGLATERELRVDHIRSGGFCPLHTWQYAEISSDLGISLGYAELAEAAAERLRLAGSNVTEREDLGGAVAGLVPGPDRCPACLALAEMERGAASELVAELSARAGDDPAVPTLCVPHVAAVLAVDPDLERGKRLVGALAHSLERASVDMRMYSLKREALRRRLLTDEEESAYLRALSHLSGDRDLAAPWRHR